MLVGIPVPRIEVADILVSRCGLKVRVAAPKTPPVLKLESVGLLVIAVLALIFILIHYWPHIAWSAR